MSEITTVISQRTVKKLLSYDDRHGLLTWRERRGPSALAGDEAGTVRTDGRVALVINGKTYLAHHIIWLYMTGELPKSRLTFHDKNPQNLTWKNIQLESMHYSTHPAAAYQRQHRKKRRWAITNGLLDARR